MAKKDKSLTENKDLTVETTEIAVDTEETLDAVQDAQPESADTIEIVQETSDAEAPADAE